MGSCNRGVEHAWGGALQTEDLQGLRGMRGGAANRSGAPIAPHIQGPASHRRGVLAGTTQGLVVDRGRARSPCPPPPPPDDPSPFGGGMLPARAGRSRHDRYALLHLANGARSGPGTGTGGSPPRGCPLLGPLVVFPSALAPPGRLCSRHIACDSPSRALRLKPHAGIAPNCLPLSGQRRPLRVRKSQRRPAVVLPSPLWSIALGLGCRERTISSLRGPGWKSRGRRHRALLDVRARSK